MEPTLNPGRERFVELASDRTRPAVVRTVAALDTDVDPLAAYATLADGANHTFLLESAEKVASSDPDGAFAPNEEDGHARYSFVGYDPAALVTVGPDETNVECFTERYRDAFDSDTGDVLDRLRGALPDADRVNFSDTDRQQLDGGLVGYLAYDSVYDLHLDEVGLARPDSPVPDAQFVLTTKTVVFDHASDEVSLVFTPLVRPEDDPHAIYDAMEAEVARVREAISDAAVETGGFERRDGTAGSREAYEESVRRAKEHVLDGDSYQVVLSRARELVGEIDPRGLYAALRDINPSPYMYLLEYGDRSVVGASPETLVSVRGDEVVSNPLAGTCSRGTSPVEDRRLAGELLADEKERAEHTMLVDLARNDTRRVSRPGSVQVAEFMTVLKYSHVQHIESTVTGELADDVDAFDAVRAAFPMGTLSGAPKVRAMEIIDALEATPRGLYGGGVGYFSWDGDADVAITIRTALVEHTGTEDRITVRAGAGIVADSDPESEYAETEQKIEGVLTALDRIERPTVAEPSR
ncbi:anthranilate synthase component I [Halococcus sediminicola]|uniref:anthranilate synthase component I n=1 Tax=Halococcus sediminicola TaxID=1264579 RepID=UPI000678E96F|nr:anthranilate synthase component I [Halococcus sediminicola]